MFTKDLFVWIVTDFRDFYRMAYAPATHQEDYGIFGATLKTGSRGFDLQERIERFAGSRFFSHFFVNLCDFWYSAR